MENVEKIHREIARRNKEIEAKEAEISVLQADIRDLKIFVEGMNQTLKFLAKPAPSAKPFSLRPGSDLDKVRVMLDNSLTSLHISSILTGLGKDPQDKKARASLVGSLNSYAQEQRIFSKTGPATYGLIGREYIDDLI